MSDRILLKEVNGLEIEDERFDIKCQNSSTNVLVDLDGHGVEATVFHPERGASGRSKAEVNFSALGSIEPEYAELYAKAISVASKIARLINSEWNSNAGHKSRLELFQTIHKILINHSDGKALYKKINLPNTWLEFDNEVYGKKAMLYLSFADMETRRFFEDELEKRGFKVSRDYCSVSGGCSSDSPTTEIQVAYFKGYHWDE